MQHMNHHSDVFPPHGTPLQQSVQAEPCTLVQYEHKCRGTMQFPVTHTKTPYAHTAALTNT